MNHNKNKSKLNNQKILGNKRFNKINHKVVRNHQIKMNNNFRKADRNLLNWRKNLRRRHNKERLDKKKLKKSMKKRKDS